MGFHAADIKGQFSLTRDLDRQKYKERSKKNLEDALGKKEIP